MIFYVNVLDSVNPCLYVVQNTKGNACIYMKIYKQR